MADIIPFPGERLIDDREAARLEVFIDGEKLPPLRQANLGNLEDWAWTAVAYLKTVQSMTRGSNLTLVSVPALAIVCAYVEELAARLEIIPPPPSEPEVA